mmetsp:Transcript_4203/g.5972  ORF Transcript_4203/g.5972 Transcript_4203/m.5972 type:complete len:140 (-) Transcript_4203:1083-1502(-)
MSVSSPSSTEQRAPYSFTLRSSVNIRGKQKSYRCTTTSTTSSSSLANCSIAQNHQPKITFAGEMELQGCLIPFQPVVDHSQEHIRLFFVWIMPAVRDCLKLSVRNTLLQMLDFRTLNNFIMRSTENLHIGTGRDASCIS